MKVSLIISVYKNTAALAAVLQSLQYQTFRDFEVVVSEDGASEIMQNFMVTQSWAGGLLHLTQPDVGWRKNKALNNAIRQCHGDLMIFIDGDCVLHHDFIRQHVMHSRPERIGAGKRIKLGKGYSEWLLQDSTRLPELERRFFKEWRSIKKDGAGFLEEGFYVEPNSLLGVIPRMRSMTWLKGCNMSFQRSAIEKINGFDEDYILPAIGEDIDLTWRFKAAGFKLFSLRNRAVQYHLYHVENWTDQSINQKMMAEKMVRNEFVCKNGLTTLH